MWTTSTTASLMPTSCGSMRSSPRSRMWTASSWGSTRWRPGTSRRCRQSTTTARCACLMPKSSICSSNLALRRWSAIFGTEEDLHMHAVRCHIRGPTASDMLIRPKELLWKQLMPGSEADSKACCHWRRRRGCGCPEAVSANCDQSALRDAANDDPPSLPVAASVQPARQAADSMKACARRRCSLRSTTWRSSRPGRR